MPHAANTRDALRPPEEIKKRVTGDIKKLNRRLLEIACQLDAELRARTFAKTPPGILVASFYRKMVNTFSAIEILKKNRQIEEAWILLRVLLENHVTFFYFLKNDAKEMTRRYNDAAMLDKMKHLRAVDFYSGTPLARLHRRGEWEEVETEIKSRYDRKTLDAVRRNGFTGL